MTTILSYLDPGSGSALLGTVFALVGALAYSLKSLFFRLIGKKTTDVKSNDKISIFSEGKSYWGTFKPIVEELLARKIPFSYYTMDINDPALAIDSPYMFSRLYDKDKVSSFAKLESIKSDILLSTTPNIGCQGYPLRRPKRVNRLIHVFHDPLGDVSTYRKGSLDFYDEVLTVSPQNDSVIRILEKKRGKKPKKLIPVGVPYLDEYVKNIQNFSGDKVSTKKTVLVASSWGDKSVLKVYGHFFVKELIDAGYHVVVRPHPQSYNNEKKFIEKCEHDIKSWGGEWDRDMDGTKAMFKADVMISDVSGVRIDFAYLFEKPVISMKIPKSSIKDFEADDLGDSWMDKIAMSIGIELDTTTALVSEIQHISSLPRDNIRRFRDSNCINFGHSASSIVDYLVS